MNDYAGGSCVTELMTVYTSCAILIFSFLLRVFLADKKDGTKSHRH